jgi:hypothetical protein
LDVGHPLQPDRVAHAAVDLGLVDVLDTGLDPPQVAHRVPDPTDPIAPEQVGNVGDRDPTRVERPLEGRIGILDVEAAGRLEYRASGA